MHFYDPSEGTLLTTDASPTGLGAIHSNEDDQGYLTNVAYASRSLTEVGSRYSKTEREVLAVVWGCERFHLYLIGTQFSIPTDHKALEVIYSPESKLLNRVAVELSSSKEHLLRSCVCLFVPREGRQSTGSSVKRQTIGKTLHLVAAVGYLLMRGQHIQITLGRNRNAIKVELVMAKVKFRQTRL